MAAPSYTTDLLTVDLAENVTGWSELTNHTGGAAVAQEGDYFLQGSFCISQAFGNKTGTAAGLEYDNGANITLAANDVFMFWQVCLAGNAMDTFVNGGQRLGVGSTAGNINFWISGGSDFGRNPYGGWSNIAIDPTFTPDFTEGTPVATNYRIFGSIINLVSQVSKGNMHGVDAIRWGRGELIIELGDLGNGYGTFGGVATQNDNQTNRWGLLQGQGTGYLWKGLMSFGNVTNLCDFRDSNVNITIDDTPRAYTLFNRIEINNASSRVDWTGVNIASVNPNQISTGSLEVIDNATVNIIGCTFTDMSTFIFQSNSTMTNTTFRRCGQTSQVGATFTGCIFDESIAAVALLTTNTTVITDMTFNSDGTGHAVQGFAVAGDYTIDNWNFTGYAAVNGSTGNEAVYVTATTGIVNLNVSGGSGILSYRTAGATVNVIASAVLTVGGVRSGSDVWIYRTDNKTLLASADPVTVTDGAPIDGVQYYKLVYSYNASVLNGVLTQIKIFNLGYINDRINYTLTSADARVGIQQRIDRNYFNP